MPVINQVAQVVPVPPTATICGWQIDTTCVPGWDALPEAVRELAAARATEILWALSGRQFANCPVVWRPCAPGCANAGGYRTWPVGLSATGASGPWMFPYIDSGIWRNCACPGPCSCGARCEVPFPSPVASVEEVRVDGAVLDPSAYRIDGVRGIPHLVRTDGDCWSKCQDMNLDPTELGTWAVTYTPGKVLPSSAAYVTGLLAGEYAKDCQGGDCALPEQLLSLSRNGVEVQVADPDALLEAGLTGIAAVDLWIRSVNPSRKSRPSRSYSPDMRPGRVTR